MTQRITITASENDKVYNLFHTHLAYMNILQYLISTKISDTTLYDKKWDEAVKINLQLEEEKHKIEKKYKPSGDWDRFEFDFEKHQVVFIKDE